MIEDKYFKSLVGYELGDKRYDNVGRTEGIITQEIKRCNASPNTLSYMTHVMEKNTKTKEKDQGFEIGD